MRVNSRTSWILRGNDGHHVISDSLIQMHPMAIDALTRRAGTLTTEHVHVWFVNLRDWPWSDDDSLLDKVERERASRFVRSENRSQFVRAHSALRRILASYLCTSATELIFNTNAYGRPRLADKVIDFNVSHSGDWMALALGYDLAFGIDIEAWREGVGDEVLLERYFSLNEVAQWRMELPSRRPGAFARLWTRKEATLKALGCGLIDDLSAIDTTSESSLRLSLSHLRRNGRLPSGVAEGIPTIYDLVGPDRYEATLVSFGCTKVAVFHWHNEFVQP